MVAPSKPLYVINNRTLVIVRLTTKASRNTVTGLAQNADGGVIKASVTAVPEAGKANTALIKLLAKEWKLPKLTLKIIKGTTVRKKTVEALSNLYLVQPVLETWLKKVC